MSNQEPFIPTQKPDTLPIPLPLIIVIAIGCYVFIIVVGLIIKQCLQSRGICGECRCCGKEDEQICQCCMVLGQACNCFECRGLNTTLNRCCPHRTQIVKQMGCVDIILCQCCAPHSHGKEPLCGACYNLCSSWHCHQIESCLCFTCNYDEDEACGRYISNIDINIGDSQFNISRKIRPVRPVVVTEDSLRQYRFRCGGECSV